MSAQLHYWVFSELKTNKQNHLLSSYKNCFWKPQVYHLRIRKKSYEMFGSENVVFLLYRLMISATVSAVKQRHKQTVGISI